MIYIKTIAEHMKDILEEYGYESVSYGDVKFLDECAIRSNHTNLNQLPIKEKHTKILNALENSELFVKYMVKNNNKTMRRFWLKDI